MAPSNKAELSDIVWALRVIADEKEIQKACIILMDWNPKTQTQYVRERSMLRFKANPELPPDEQRIATLWQGPTPRSGGNYPGDSEMFLKNFLTIQVHRVKPIYEKISKPDVVALGLIVPNSNKGILGQFFKPGERDH
jgi:hypothetical protein